MVCADALSLMLLLMLVLLQLCLSLLLDAVSVSRCCGLCRVAAAARVSCVGLWLLLHVG